MNVYGGQGMTGNAGDFGVLPDNLKAPVRTLCLHGDNRMLVPVLDMILPEPVFC